MSKLMVILVLILSACKTAQYQKVQKQMEKIGKAKKVYDIIKPSDKSGEEIPNDDNGRVIASVPGGSTQTSSSAVSDIKHIYCPWGFGPTNTGTCYGVKVLKLYPESKRVEFYDLHHDKKEIEGFGKVDKVEKVASLGEVSIGDVLFLNRALKDGMLNRSDSKWERTQWDDCVVSEIFPGEQTIQTTCGTFPYSSFQTTPKLKIASK